MIEGIGIDMIRIARLEKIFSSSRKVRFCEKIFSPQELEYAFRKKNPHEHLAGFFAVKESFMKALGKGWRKGLKFSEIKIFHNDEGAPYLALEGAAQELLKNLKFSKVHISISHDKEYAIGTTIIES
jgi:holo-[acyl-carrier protein] synthase